MQIILLDLGTEMRGGQWQVYYLARALALSSQFTPVVVAPAGAPLLEHAGKVDGVRTCAVGGRREWDIRSVYALRKLVRKEGARIIHTHCARSAALGGLCKKLWPEVKLIHSRRVSYPLRSGWRSKKYLAADAIVAVSQEIGDVLVESGVPDSLVSVIHSGIDTERYQQKRDRNDGRYVIGMVGALTPQKGHEVLLRALAELKERDGLPPWEARFIGEGPLFGELSDLADELGVSSNIALLGLQDSRMFLPDFDVLVVPSVDGEGSSGVIKEGWAVGVPVVCSDLSSNMELIVHDQNGLAFPNRAHEALADMLAVLGKDEARRKALVEQGAASARAFSDVRMAEGYMALYSKLLA